MLLRLLLVIASEGQRHLRVLGWSCGGYEMKIIIEYQDQNGRWHRFQEKHNAADAYQVAKNRAESTKMRHRLVDGDGRLLDLIEP